MKTRIRTILLVAGGCCAVLIGPVPRVLAQDEPEPTPLQEKAAQLADLDATIDALESLYETAEGEDHAVFRDQLRRRWEEHHDLVGQLVNEIESAREAGGVERRVTQQATSSLQREIETIDAAFAPLQTLIAERRSRQAAAAPDSALELELELSDLTRLLDRNLEYMTDDFEHAATLGLDTGEGEAALDSTLAWQAALAAARVELALDQQSIQRSRRSKTGVDTLVVDMQLAVLKERLDANTTSLRALADLLHRREIETAEYEQLLLTATGDLGTELLDPKVVGGLLSNWWQAFLEWVADNAGAIFVRLITILLILLLTAAVARLGRKAMARLLASSRVSASELLKRLAAGFTSKLIWFVGILVVLSVFGINIGPALAGLGIVGFILGFALQDSLSNFASGLMIMIYRPFDLGDLVTTGGVTGTVKDLTLVSTVITTLDNQRLIVPNGMVWNEVINNATAERIRRVDLVFGIGYEDDMEKARRILEEILESNQRVLKKPEPVVRVHSLGESSVDFVCRPWCKTEDYWDVYWEVTRAAKERFDEEGVSIPFPQRDVHVYATGGEIASGVPAEEGGST